MSIVQQEDELKGVPDDRLVTEMQNPSGMFPAYLVFTEINRREELRSRFADEQSQMPTTSMAEEAVAQMMNGGMPMEQPMEQGLGQGMPQDMQGMQGMPPGMDQGMPPGMPPGMDQGMPPMPPGMDQGIASGPPMQMMSNGGMVRGFYDGALVTRYPWIKGYEDLGVPDEVLESLDIAERSNPGSAASYLGGISKQRTTGSPQFKSQLEEAVRDRTRGLDTDTTFGLFPSERSNKTEELRPLIRESLYSGKELPPIAETGETAEAAAEAAAAKAVAVAAAGAGAGAGPPAPEADPLAGLRAQAAGMNDVYKTDPNADADMQDLEDRLAKLNPAPDRRNLLAQSMMQIGSGLMQSPTWQGGLGKGFDQVSQTVGKYGDDVRAYNQGRSITEQALFDTERARADKYRETQFRDRKTGLESELSIAGLEQRGRIADQTNKRMVGNSELNRIQDQIIAIQKVSSIGLSPEQLKAREESLLRLQEQARLARGGARLTRGRVEPISG